MPVRYRHRCPRCDVQFTASPELEAPSTRRRPRLIGWLLVPVSVVVFALLAWLSSASEALVAAALIAVVAGAYAWRARMLGGMLPTADPGDERRTVDCPRTPPVDRVDTTVGGECVDADEPTARVPSTR